MSPRLDASLRLLDLDPEATLDDAKKARRELAMVWHPDRFPDNEELRLRAEDKLKAINAAYEDVTNFLKVSKPKKPILALPDRDGPLSDARKTVMLSGVPVRDRAIQTSVGLEIGGDRFAEVIAAGSTVPCAVGKTFTNARDFQTELTIRLRHGAPDTPASEATSLGRVTFVDLPPGPRGFMRMQVIFAVDETGTLAIGATDLDSGSPVLATSA
ncbi:MAG: Hsp70 family protein [Bacteroidota bacterium]